jgi:thioredoxin reductase (NADPH)
MNMQAAGKLEVDIAVIGDGVAGLTAAAQCAERGAAVALIGAGPLLGGLVANLGRLDGFPLDVSGAGLADGMLARCTALGVQRIEGAVTGLEAARGGLVLQLADRAITAKKVIVATGAKLRQLGVPGEAELFGRGVSQCDWCDGGFFRNQSVLVVGGGDSAFQAALHLAQQCDSVTLVIRGATMRARRSYVEAVANNERIAFRWETQVEKILGTDGVTGALLRDVATGALEEQPAAGIFVFVGIEPNSGFLPPQVARDDVQRVVTDASYLTGMPGVYAVGAVRSGFRGDVLGACGEAAAAAAIACEALEAA